MFVYLNDQLVEAEKATLHISDLAIQRGYGIFDFFRVREGMLLYVEDHLDRFLHSTNIMHLAAPYSKDELLSILAASSAQRLEAANLARFELDKPRLRLTVNQQSFSFGMFNPLSHEQYIATQNAVYLISARYFAMASAPPANLASKQLFAADEVPIGFQFGKSHLALTDGKWKVLPARPNLSQDQLNQWADEWRHAASLGNTLYSGKAGVAEFSIQLSNGKNILIKILQREPELILLRSDENREYYFPAETAKRLLIF